MHLFPTHENVTALTKVYIIAMAIACNGSAQLIKPAEFGPMIYIDGECRVPLAGAIELVDIINYFTSLKCQYWRVHLWYI